MARPPASIHGLFATNAGPGDMCARQGRRSTAFASPTNASEATAPAYDIVGSSHATRDARFLGGLGSTSGVVSVSGQHRPVVSTT